MPNEAVIEVCQADRDAAGPFAASLKDMQEIFAGEADGLPVVQAFARHRIAHTPVPAGLREALEALCGEEAIYLTGAEKDNERVAIFVPVSVVRKGRQALDSANG